METEYMSKPMSGEPESRPGTHDQFGMELARMNSLLDSLEEKVGVVLRPTHPSPLEDDRSESLSKHRDLVVKLSELNSRLSRVIERIDL